jgi:hypothetical protein
LKSLGIDNPRQHALHLVLNKADLLPSAAQVKLGNEHRHLHRFEPVSSGSSDLHPCVHSPAQKPSAMNLIRGRVRKGYHQLGFADCNVSLVSAKTGFGVHRLFAVCRQQLGAC